jgi:hypothetical protein
MTSRSILFFPQAWEVRPRQAPRIAAVPHGRDPVAAFVDAIVEVTLGKLDASAFSKQADKRV